MAIFNNFPYVNYHEKNLDTLQKYLKEAETAAKESAEDASTSAAAATAAQTAAESAQAAAEAAEAQLRPLTLRAEAAAQTAEAEAEAAADSAYTAQTSMQSAARSEAAAAASATQAASYAATASQIVENYGKRYIVYMHYSATVPGMVINATTDITSWDDFYLAAYKGQILVGYNESLTGGGTLHRFIIPRVQPLLPANPTDPQGGVVTIEWQDYSVNGTTGLIANHKAAFMDSLTTTNYSMTVFTTGIL